VVAREQEADQQHAQRVPAEVRSIGVHEVPGHQPPGFAVQHGEPLVAQHADRLGAGEVHRGQHGEHCHGEHRIRTAETQ